MRFDIFCLLRCFHKGTYATSPLGTDGIDLLTFGQLVDDTSEQGQAVIRRFDVEVAIPADFLGNPQAWIILCFTSEGITSGKFLELPNFQPFFGPLRSSRKRRDGTVDEEETVGPSLLTFFHWNFGVQNR